MQKKIFGDKKYVADIILIVLFAVIALSVFAFTRLGREQGAYVRVSIDGETVAEYSLGTDGEYALNGGTNILVIENGEAYIREANCPRQLCVKQGKISLAGESIVCLENRVSVTVIDSDDGILEVK